MCRTPSAPSASTRPSSGVCPTRPIYDITKIDWWFLGQDAASGRPWSWASRKASWTREKYLEAKKLRLPGQDHPAPVRCRQTAGGQLPRRLTRWWIPAPPSLPPRPLTSTPPATRTTRLLSSLPSTATPTRKRSWSSVPAPSASVRASSSTTARSTAVWTLKKHGCEAIIVNNNPETVSTDFDTGDRLYFDPLNPERRGQRHRYREARRLRGAVRRSDRHQAGQASG